ncbi:tRNA (adenosine(37)-N6)-dimethylallyltransferase MiaA [Scleromatobacter humisilvae]|uniref:tRNA dimethylallyltransferase n=1 Tax=Scleromatobacter humisilvae TaxID=2897159 RepID=A0A9X1YMI6_9BURK|nr:tRNA (adenosine(37)-N6)-dimethylallyltransferase MiaA [Scleromatobacter humisilvae]MCK9688527.1 tRNA (adenosine(37)-N6)-dimethylallyltransferase MiaA [Scleromatobacter humisilvae]
MDSGLKWLGLAGPTASGKTALALALARRWPVEVVSVDSALVYRGMDIGTAKPSAAEQAAAPHHLLDILSPAQSYSAAQFVADARRLIDEIRSRGRWPLLVGGTMMYFKALIDGIDEMPAADPEIRAAIDAEAAQLGWPAMHARLAEVDPATAARLKPNDSQRIQRALEVWRASGTPLSTLHLRARRAAPPADGALIALEPASRAWLHARIAQRFDAMLASGFLDEVRRLRADPGLHLDLPSTRCVGYRQAWEALDRADPPDLVDIRERGVAATRQLAKRQITWLRSMAHRRVVEADAAEVEARLVTLVESLIGPAGTAPD